MHFFKNSSEKCPACISMVFTAGLHKWMALYNTQQKLRCPVSQTSPPLPISNSLGDKFSYWDSQNVTLITHYEERTPETTLNLSYFEKIMSHWEYI